MAYEGLFNALGLREWCDADAEEGPLTMEQLLAQAQGGGDGEAASGPWWDLPFPSLDVLHEACGQIWRTRDLTAGLEWLFLEVKGSLQFVLDPITQPLSWLLDGSLYLFTAMPWYLVIALIVVVSMVVSRSASITAFVAASLGFLAFIDHLHFTIQTLSIILVCTALCIMFGVPIGIAMSRNSKLQKAIIPVLDMLQTLPTFVYLIPLIFLFSVTESKLYGIAIILYAIVPVIRMTDLGIRLVDKDLIEASDAFGLNDRQKLWGLQIPLAMPNIMAGINQTIMMSLAMVVIASLVSAPGLGVQVLRGIRNLELGVGLVAGLGIVLLAVILDRVSKASLDRINKVQKG